MSELTAEESAKKSGIGNILRIINNQQSGSETLVDKSKVITISTLQENREISLALERADLICKEMNLLKHGKFHAILISKIVGEIIKKSGGSQRDIQLGEITGYIHDLGYRLDIDNHSYVSAGMAYEKLKQLGMAQEEIDKICLAIAYHNCQKPISSLGAALTIAETADFSKDRVPKEHSGDMYVRLMSMCEKNKLIIDETYKIIRLTLEIKFVDVKIEDYIKETKKRYQFCRYAAEYLGFEYQVIVNDQIIEIK